MTSVADFVAAMEVAAARLRKWDAKALRSAARELDDAAAQFDPDDDLTGGLTRLNAAVARAAWLYGHKTGRSLFVGFTDDGGEAA